MRYLAPTYTPVPDPWSTPEGYFHGNPRKLVTQLELDYFQKSNPTLQQTPNPTILSSTPTVLEEGSAYYSGPTVGQVATDYAIDTAIQTGLNNLQTPAATVSTAGPTNMATAPPSAQQARTLLQTVTSSNSSQSLPHENLRSLPQQVLEGPSIPRQSTIKATPAATPAATSSATSSAIRNAPKFLSSPRATKAIKFAGRAAPVLGTLATLGAVYNQAQQTEAEGKDVGGQLAGNVIGGGLGTKIGAGIGTAAAGAMAATGVLAPFAPLAPIVGSAIGGYLGSTFGGDVGKNVNLIPDKDPNVPTNTHPLAEEYHSRRDDFTSPNSRLYQEQQRRQRQGALDALYLQGMQRAQEQDAAHASMILQSYLSQAQQYGNLLGQAIR